MCAEVGVPPGATGRRRLAPGLVVMLMAAACGPDSMGRAPAGDRPSPSADHHAKQTQRAAKTSNSHEAPTAAGPGADHGAVADPSKRPPVAAESSLGVRDQGIFSDLDPKVQISLEGKVAPGATDLRATIDRDRQLLVLYRASWPIKAYPLGGPATLEVGGHALALRPGDRAELEPLLTPSSIAPLSPDDEPPPGDADRDGIPDPLDVLIGGKKTVLDGAPYGGSYIRIDYPGGDIPRGLGVCTDVVIRALRNAGLDLQREVHEDIRKRRAAYPMVTKPNSNIDHRRVKTILPYFVRHFEPHSIDPLDNSDPYRPGDIVFMDTFPSRPGPDHIGVVSDTVGGNGHPLVINSWTTGFRTSEMELVGAVPITHRFRMPANARQVIGPMR